METPVTTTSMQSPMSMMDHTGTSMSPEPVFKLEDYDLSSSHSLSVTKPVKKRKSWGQELPEPKTALPPRKRAKTDDEKEQRRIERIKRNRAAAHNSRERKRVEAEHLATVNGALLQQIQNLQKAVAHKEAQLAKCRELLPDGLPEVSAEEFASTFDLNDHSSTSTSPMSYTTIDPRASFSTPATTPADHYLKTEDIPSTPLPPPASSEARAGSSDPTQHSAAMLCDLQCRSDEQTTSPPSPRSTFHAWWTRLMLILTHTSIMNCYKTILLTFWTNSPMRMTRLLRAASQTFSTSTPCRYPILSTPFTTTMHPTWTALAQQLLLATGQSSTGFSAQALKQCQSLTGMSFDHGNARSFGSFVRGKDKRHRPLGLDGHGERRDGDPGHDEHLELPLRAHPAARDLYDSSDRRRQGDDVTPE